MNKNELQIIVDAIDNKNPKRELNFAYIDFNRMCIIATNTRKVVKYFLRADEVAGCKGVHYLHKKILKAIIPLCAKDVEYKFEHNHIVIDGVKVKLNTNAIEDKFEYPNMDKVFATMYENEFVTDSINFIDFDLTHQNTHINSDMFKALQEFSDVSQYKVESIAQKANQVGMVKISGYKDNAQRFVSVLMGIEYKPAEPTLFD